MKRLRIPAEILALAVCTTFLGLANSVLAGDPGPESMRSIDGASWYSVVAALPGASEDELLLADAQSSGAPDRPSPVDRPGDRPGEGERRGDDFLVSDSASGAGSDSRPEIVFTQALEQVLTTARRRSEFVQRTPVAVTSLSETETAVREVRRLEDLDGLVPSLAFSKAIGNSNAGRISIRGVTEGDPNPAVDPAVGVYVDGVYAPRAQGLSLPLFDIERVEVVRGPQGTLFGKNTIGGAINVITRRPTFEFGGDASVRIGNFDRVDTRASLNVPLLPERAALRVSLATNYDDGYIQNPFLDERVANDRLLGGRGQLLILPTENLEVLLSGEYLRQDRRPVAGKCAVVGPVNPTVQGLLNVINAQLMASSMPTIDVQRDCAEDGLRSDFKAASDLSFAEDDLRTTVLSSKVTWSLGEALTFESTTSFRNQDLDLRQDNDGSALPLAQPIVDAGGSDQRTFSQELKLNGSSLENRLDFVLGLYAFTESIDDTAIGGVFSGIIPGLLPVTEEELDVNNRSYSAYGALTFALTDKLKVSAGLRRTVERKRVKKSEITLTDGFSPAGMLLPAGTALLPDGFERSKRFDDFSPSFSLAYTPTETLLVYASYSTGFRSGGFNGRANSVNQDFLDIDSEELTTYEAGFKSQFFESRLQLNGAVYFSIYEDIQRPILTSAAGGIPSAIVRNAAEARLRGAELEIAALVMPELRLEASLSAFRSRYTDFDLFGNDVVSGQAFSDVVDAPLPSAPDYLATFAVNYQRDLGRVGLLSSRVQWTHRGEQGNGVEDLGAIRSSKYGLLDAQLGLVLADGRTQISLFGTNLLDRTYIENGLNVSDSVGVAIRFLGAPRRYGIEIRRAF